LFAFAAPAPHTMAAKTAAAIMERMEPPARPQCRKNGVAMMVKNAAVKLRLR
jgi:hypothetical protein